MLGVAFATLIVLVVAFLLRLTMHRPPSVTLPETTDLQSGEGVVQEAGQDALRRVEVTPQTVQRVIERLARPANYSRTITIDRFWTDGSGQMTATVYVLDGWTRVDTARIGAQTRHLITGDGKSWIWYGEDERVFTGAAAFSADEEQNIPTYEDVLRLNTASIAAADYRTFGGINCIYVETAADEAGYVECYWVSVDSGLLVAATRTEQGTLIYRMSGLEALVGGADEEAFRLPNGESLLLDAENPESEETKSEG